MRTNKGDEVDLVLSFGHKKIDVDTPEEDFDYSSDHSTMIFRNEITEVSPEKYDDRSTAEIRRENKVTSSSYEGRADKFILELYENPKSPVHYGFSYEHSVAMKKTFSVLKINSKYMWDVYLCEDNVCLSWPTKKNLTLDSFKVLPLYHKDKELSKRDFPPENGIWPYK